ncbi:16S rRNA processing protein RimM [bacterium]|nr:16S rRNA processing protein RimM [bacterium]
MSNSEKTELITIGKVSKAHGIKGEIKIIPLTTYPERFNDLEKVFVEFENEVVKEFKIEKVRVSTEAIFLKFEGINDRNEAEKFSKAYISIVENDLVSLEEGEFFVFEIIGLSVETVEKEFLGVVTDVMAVGDCDVYVVERESDNKEFLIPATKEFVVSIDFEAEKITIKPIPGLLI